MNKYDVKAVEELLQKITVLDSAKTDLIYNEFKRQKEYLVTQGFCLGGITVALIWLLFLVLNQI